ncbi:hypothetical protein C8P66_108113 [Humitalea rosea]|uniref:Uncharacterized protein n=1 Tax=Humitalea rosea TaxID=990373 RepID=A0A2W7INB1_9PROT|nr:hypothetical protein [Humitalea rosea]PZW46834.1 hypothetical protein C8P66_108113 [Humitalea rosea]
MTDTDAKARATPLRAQAILDLKGETTMMEFDAISISTDDPEHLVVALADGAGRSLTLLLPRGEVKRLLNWRMLMSL